MSSHFICLLALFDSFYSSLMLSGHKLSHAGSGHIATTSFHKEWTALKFHSYRFPPFFTKRQSRQHFFPYTVYC